jgi:hypothetical protein
MSPSEQALCQVALQALVAETGARMAFFCPESGLEDALFEFDSAASNSARLDELTASVARVERDGSGNAWLANGDFLLSFEVGDGDKLVAWFPARVSELVARAALESVTRLVADGLVES